MTEDGDPVWPELIVVVLVVAAFGVYLHRQRHGCFRETMRQIRRLPERSHPREKERT
jgi:hypothetical protein